MNTMPPDGQMPPQASAPLSVDHQRAILRHRIAYAAKWWYWIAGITALNTGAFFMHIGFGFALETGVVEVVNWIIHRNPGFEAAGLAIDALIVGLVALWGLICTKGLRWAFWIGIMLYSLDTILVLALKDWINAAFHAYAIYQIYQGVASANLLRKLDAAVAAQGPHYAQQQASGWSAQTASNPPENPQPVFGHLGVDGPQGQLDTTQAEPAEAQPETLAE